MLIQRLANRMSAKGGDGFDDEDDTTTSSSSSSNWTYSDMSDLSDSFSSDFSDDDDDDTYSDVSLADEDAAPVDDADTAIDSDLPTNEFLFALARSNHIPEEVLYVATSKLGSAAAAAATELRECVRAQCTELLAQHGDPARHPDAVDRIEKAAWTCRSLLKEYIEQVATGVALLCLRDAFIDRELALGTARYETLHKTDLQHVCCGNEEQFIHHSRRLRILGNRTIYRLFSCILRFFSIAVDGGPQLQGTNEWKIELERDPEDPHRVMLRKAPVNWSVCIQCSKPMRRPVFSSIHKCGSRPYTFGFCSVGCFSDIVWTNQNLQNLIHRIRY
jgi:hypothetical protein